MKLVQIESLFSSSENWICLRYWIANEWLEQPPFAWQFYQVVCEFRPANDAWIVLGCGSDDKSDFLGEYTPLYWQRTLDIPAALEHFGFELDNSITPAPVPEPQYHVVGSVASTDGLPAVGEPMGVYQVRDEDNAYVFCTNRRGDLDTAGWAWACEWFYVSSLVGPVNSPTPPLD